MAAMDSPLLHEVGDESQDEKQPGEVEGSGGARLGDAQKLVIKNPSNINDLVQYLDTSLYDAQLQSIQLSCSALDIPVKQIGGDRANNSFSDLYTAMKNKFTEGKVQGVLRFILERVHYDMTGLEWLPRLDESLFQEYRKLDMLLSLAYMVTSMTVEEYERFRDQLIRQDGVTDNQERILHDYSVDSISCRCHLLKLLHERGHFDIDDVENVFHWLDMSGCSDYRTEIVEYCNRHKLEVPEPQDPVGNEMDGTNSIKVGSCNDGGESDTHSTTSTERANKSRSCLCCLLSCVITTVVILCFASFFTSVALTAVTLTLYDKLDETSSSPASSGRTYLVGANTTVRIGSCFDHNLIDQVNVIAARETGDGSNNTAVYAIQKSDIRSEMTYLPNITVRTLNNAHDSLPIGVSYNGIPLYTAGDGGMIDYSVSLINNNVTRNSCALRLIVFDSPSNFFEYQYQNRDPLFLPPNFYTNTSCVSENGTHYFHFQLRANTFFYFAASHVADVSFTVNASGYISEYSISDHMQPCILTFSSRCTFSLNQKRNDETCLFGESSNRLQGKVFVMVSSIPQTARDYNVSYIASTAAVGFVFILSLLLVFIRCIVCCKPCQCRKETLNKSV